MPAASATTVVDNDGRVSTWRVVSGKRRRKEVTVKDTGGSHSHFLGLLSSVLTLAMPSSRVTSIPRVTAVDGRS